MVLDIDANIGIHTLLFSKLVGQQGKVIAFEPNKLNLKRLKFNLSLNNIKNVQVVEMAVGDTIGSSEIFEVSDFSYHLGSHSLAYTESIKNLEKKKVFPVDKFP